MLKGDATEINKTLEDGGTVVFHCDAGKVKSAKRVFTVGAGTVKDLLDIIKRERPLFKGNVSMTRNCRIGYQAEIEEFIKI
jgi:hypothetical protein